MNIALIIGLSISIVVLICFSAIFSMSDIVYATVNQLRLKKRIKESDSKTAKLALKFAENYNDTLTTALFANNLVNIAASSLTTVLAINAFSNSNLGKDRGTTLMSFVLLIMLLIFGEILPKVIGRSYSYRLSLILAYPILFLKTIFFPIVFVASHIGKFFAYPFVKNKQKDEVISNEELQEIVDKIEDEGVIDEEQGELLSNAIEFKDTEAHEIMTPRVNLTFIDIEDNIEDIVKDDRIFIHSRIPVYKDTVDNVIGILPTKALLRRLLANQKVDINSLMVPVSFVPGSMGISEILKNMKQNKNHVVVVKDEYGGTDGLLTMEDILEELVGDMWDEMDIVKEPIKKIGRNLFEVDGSMNIDDLFNKFDVNMPIDADYETVNGFILDKLERFPQVGDKIRYDRLSFEVTSIDEFTVDKLFLRIGRKKNNV